MKTSSVVGGKNQRTWTEPHRKTNTDEIYELCSHASK